MQAGTRVPEAPNTVVSSLARGALQNRKIRNQTLTLSLSLVSGRGNASAIGCR